MKENWHQIITDGGMGDLIAAHVAVDWNIRHHTHCFFHVWVPDYLEEFSKHVLSKPCVIRPFSKAKAKFRHDFLGMTTEWCTNHTAIRTHAVDYAFHMLADRHVYDLNQKNYLQIKPDKIQVKQFKLPQKYIVMACTGVEPVRTMPATTANELIDYVLSRSYTPVFLGKETSKCGFKDFAVEAKPIPLNYDKGINLLNQTSLLESAKIMNDAKAFIGMDGGLLHLAGCTDAEIICGFTASSPEHVAPIRNGSQSYKLQAIEPDDHPNKYFQTWSSFKKGNFQKFDGWQDVVGSMRADKFIKALENIGV